MMRGVSKRIGSIRFACLSPDEIRKMSATKIITADTYDDEVDTAVDGLTSLLEPLLIVFLALIVGTIVIAMFLPLLSLMKGFGQAGTT